MMAGMNRFRIILALALALPALSQQTPVEAEKWEYCMVSAAYANLVSPGQKEVEATIAVCYAESAGCRKRTFVARAPASGSDPTTYSLALTDVTAKALADLGTEGWELVSFVPDGDQKFLWLGQYVMKRRKP